MNHATLGRPPVQTNPVVLGASEAGFTGFLTSNDCTAFYYTIDLAPGDPIVINNNFPYFRNRAGYSLSKTRTSPTGSVSATVGQTVSFDVTIANTGTATLATVPVVDTFNNASLAFLNAVPVPDSVIGNNITWTNVGPLLAGASTTLVVNFTAIGDTGAGDHTNVVVATPTTPPSDPPVPPMTSDAPYRVSAPGYTLNKSLTSPTSGVAIVSNALIFEIVIANTGNVDLVTVPVVDTYDEPFLDFVSSVPPPDGVASGMLSWVNVGPLVAGASTTIVVNVLGEMSTGGSNLLNNVVTTPTTPPTEPPVPPMTNDEPYEIIDPPTVALISDIRGYVSDDGTVIEWETASEVGTAGFNIYRLNGGRVRLNTVLVPATSHAAGGVYQVVDPVAGEGDILSVEIEEIEARGRRVYGPFSVYIAGAAPQARKAGDDEKAVRSETRAAENAKREARTSSGNIVRIPVAESGMYTIGSAQLANLFDLPEWYVERMIRNGELELSCQGNRVTYVPAENGDGLYFQGEGIGDDLYETENVYWLGWGRNPRVRTVSGQDPDPVARGVFARRVRVEQDKQALPALAESPEEDFWVWKLVLAAAGDSPGRDFTVEVDAVDASGGHASLSIGLKGGSDTGVDGEHQPVIEVNGTEVGTGQFSGTDNVILTLSFDAGLLANGDNTVNVRGILDDGVTQSLFYVDHVQVDYPRSLTASADHLEFSVTGSDAVTVFGFSEEEINVLDISRSGRPSVVSETRVEAADGGFSVSFVPPTEDGRYVAFTVDGVRNASGVTAETPTSLTEAGNRADYVIITLGEWTAAAETLAAHRRNDGLETMVVDIEDIYTAFNHGLAGPHAIQRFLAHAHEHWALGPRYAVLVGDG
ncbi:MAG: C25 family cysteine peptidase, partial [Verrucomicrobiota bacterium]